jgi:hydroxymethylglutaryl-CoA reductase (NADPH)
MDRRQSFRIEPNETVTIEIEQPSGPICGKVINIAKSGLAVLFTQPPTLKDGARVCAILPLHHSFRIHLDFLGIEIMGDETIARFSAVNEKDRQVLWLAMRVGQGKKIETGGNPSLTAERIPKKGLYSEEARKERVKFLERTTNSKLDYVTAKPIPAEDVKGNIENYIGSLQIPVGIAGPLLVHSSSGSSVTYTPLATTEGALIASTCRGARVITDSGGITSRVLRNSMNRIPMFCFSTLIEAQIFSEWVQDHVEEMRAQASIVSRYARLTSVQTELHGNRVHVLFEYATGAAAGQNMTTVCSWHVCQWIIKQINRLKISPIQDFYIDGNLSGDKKVTFRSFIKGRGREVVAEAVLKSSVIEEYFHLTTDELLEGYRTALASSIRGGMIGFNINVANVVAAIFLATGQDIASVHESSLAQIDMQKSGDDLYVSIWFPCLIVGAIGGGTGLPGQRELLNLVTQNTIDPANQLAEVIASYALALDLSTLSAIVSGEFVDSHETLGRNRPKNFFVPEHLTVDFVKKHLDISAFGSNENFSIEMEDMDSVDSIITEMSAVGGSKFLGFVQAKMVMGTGGNQTEKTLIIKSKPTDTEVSHLAIQLGTLLDKRLGKVMKDNQSAFDTRGCHHKELEIYQILGKELPEIAPKLYGHFQDDKKEAHILFIEKIDALDPLMGISPSIFGQIIEKMGVLHQYFWNREKYLKLRLSHIDSPFSVYTEAREYWSTLNRIVYKNTSTKIQGHHIILGYKLLESFDQWYLPLSDHPMTLIHNDLTPRNIGCTDNLDSQVVFYDWELSRLHYPQRDFVEFIVFSMELEELNSELLDEMIELHRKTVTKNAKTKVSSELWNRALFLSLKEFIICRLPYYILTEHYRTRMDVDRLINFAYAWHHKLDGEVEIGHLSSVS